MGKKNNYAVLIISLIYLMVSFYLQQTSSATEKLSLIDVINNVIENNPEVEAALSRITSSEAEKKEIESFFYPQVNFKESFSRTNNPPMAFYNVLSQKRLKGGFPPPTQGQSANNTGADPFSKFNNPPETNNWKSELTFTFSLFKGFADYYNLKRAESATLSSQTEYEKIKNDKIFDVVYTFITILKYDEIEAIQKEEIKRLSGELDVAKARYKEGSALVSDVLELKTELSTAQEQLLKASNEKKRYEVLLNVLLGKDITVETKIEPLLPKRWMERKDPAEISLLINDALNNRKEIKNIRYKIQEISYSLKTEKAGYYPWINSFATYELNGEKPHLGKNSWIAGISLDYKLFDGFRRKSRIDKIRAKMNETLAEKTKIILQIQKEVQSAVLDKIEALKRLEVLKHSVEEAKESLHIYEARYKVGKALVSELIAAQAKLTSQKFRYIAALYDLCIASAAIDYACGRLENDINSLYPLKRVE